jgi:O-antigen/teichoic acid export membrane protein
MKILTRTLVVAIGQTATSMERIAVLFVLSRTLSKFDYGTYQQVWLVYLLVLPLFTLGLPGSILYFIPKTEPRQHKTVVFQTIFLLEIVGVIFSIITFLTAPLFAQQFNNPELLPLLRVFSIYPLFSLPPKLVNMLMIAQEKPLYSTIISALYSMLIVIFITSPSLLGLPLVYTYYCANLGGFIFLIGLMIFLFSSYRQQVFHWDFKLLKSQVVYSTQLGLASVLGVISLQLNKVVVSSSFSPETYAVYTNGAFEIPFIGLITGSLMTVLIPEFTKRLGNTDAISSVWRLWNDATLKTAIIIFPIACSLFAFAPEFMSTLFSPRYETSASIFSIYLLLVFLRITQYGSLLQAMGKTKIILGISIVGLSLNLLLSMIFIPLLGLAGPAWASVVTTYVWALVYLVFICKFTDVSFSMIMPWRRLGKLLALSIVAGIISFSTHLIPLDYFAMLVIGLSVYFVTYIILLLLTRTLEISTIVKYYNLIVDQIRELINPLMLKIKTVGRG